VVNPGRFVVRTALRHHHNKWKIAGVFADGVTKAHIGLQYPAVAALSVSVQEKNDGPAFFRLEVHWHKT
jgi:hypothetical protein